jgi:hypothetical protein
MLAMDRAAGRHVRARRLLQSEASPVDAAWIADEWTYLPYFYDEVRAPAGMLRIVRTARIRPRMKTRRRLTIVEHPDRFEEERHHDPIIVG